MNKQTPRTPISRYPFNDINNAVTEPQFFKRFNQNNVSEFAKGQIKERKEREEREEKEGKKTRENIILFASLESLNFKEQPHMVPIIANLLNTAKELHMISNTNVNTFNSPDRFVKSFQKLQNMLHNYYNNNSSNSKSKTPMYGSGRKHENGKNKQVKNPVTSKEKKPVTNKGKKSK